jgi:hypothetical protein
MLHLLLLNTRNTNRGKQTWELFRLLIFGLLLVFCVFLHIGLHTVFGLQKMICLGQGTDLRFLWVIKLRADVGVKIFKAMFINSPNFFRSLWIARQSSSLWGNQHYSKPRYYPPFSRYIWKNCSCQMWLLHQSSSEVFYYLKGK